MKIPLTPPERQLLLALTLTLLIACFGPALAQHPHYHAFADQRSGWGLPCVMDVLSNLPFALGGLWGWRVLQRLPAEPVPGVQRPLVRLGMVVAFAGLLGLAAAERISLRAGRATAGAVLCLGPLAVMVWAMSGNLLPWVLLQGGGLLLLLWLARCPPQPGAWGLPLGLVIGLYALAKALELGDHLVFAWTQGAVSGHSLKHVVAALVVWPVIRVMHNAAHGQPRVRPCHWARVAFEPRDPSA